MRFRQEPDKEFCRSDTDYQTSGQGFSNRISR